MKFSYYQKHSRKTAIYPDLDKNIVYPTLGLAGEAGEVAEKIKKIFRDKKGRVSSEDRTEIGKELGDVLWYVSNLASELQLDLEEIANNNLEKLLSRKNRGKLQGDGDNR